MVKITVNYLSLDTDTIINQNIIPTSKLAMPHRLNMRQ